MRGGVERGGRDSSILVVLRRAPSAVHRSPPLAARRRRALVPALACTAPLRARRAVLNALSGSLFLLGNSPRRLGPGCERRGRARHSCGAWCSKHLPARGTCVVFVARTRARAQGRRCGSRGLVSELPYTPWRGGWWPGETPILSPSISPCLGNAGLSPQSHHGVVWVFLSVFSPFLLFSQNGWILRIRLLILCSPSIL